MAAGAVAGVVLEGHLQTVLGNHKITIRKKNPTIAELNDPLKKANITTPPPSGRSSTWPISATGASTPRTESPPRTRLTN